MPEQTADDASRALALEMRRLNEAVVRRQLDEHTAIQVIEQLRDIAATVEAVEPRSKLDNFGLRNRITTFVETGEWPAPPPDGSQLEFDVASPVGGELNPVSVGATYFRNGDEVIGRVNVGRCFEGPPERVHGGVICAIFDEVMGSVFRAAGTASAFTGELNVRFIAPAPVEVDLEFRARVAGVEGRKRFLEGEAFGPDGQVASATATFIEMRLDHFVT